MIVGVDLGVRSVHISTQDENFTISSRKDVRYKEIDYIYREFSSKTGEQCTFFIEEPVVAGARNLRSSLQIAQVSGALMATARKSYLVPVSTWKKEVTGKGNSNKEQVSQWLKTVHPDLYERTSGKQDFVDATCIRLYGEIVESRVTAT